MKKFLCLIFSLVFIQTSLVSCGDDFFETGIEGQWQLRQVIYKDGEVHSVDTVYYAFKKNVFKYLKRMSDQDDDVFTCYGNYTQNGSKISIDVIKSTFIPWDCVDCFDWKTLSREFTIKTQKNNRLELNLGDTLYVLRKY